MHASAVTFRWTEVYRVNIAAMDEQHKKLFQTVNELDHALRGGQGNAAVEPILGRLIEYATVHFESEESLMKEHDFPGLSTHRTQHLMFRQTIQKFLEQHQAGSTGVPVSLLMFLQTWLKQHVLKTDKLYSAYLNARGVK